MLPRFLVSAALAVFCAGGLASAQTVLFEEDFENGLGLWSATGVWHEVDSQSTCGSLVAPFPSGTKAAWFGEANPGQCSYFGNSLGELTLLVPISIPVTATDVRLRYETYEETECPEFSAFPGNCGWDHRFVQVSSNLGQTWADVAFGAEERVWHEKSADLDNFRGQDILLRFRFDPIDGVWNSYLGWLVDDIRVEYGAPGPLNYCHGKTTFDACTPTITYSGWPTLTGNDDFHIGAVLLLNQRLGKLFWSRAPNSQPFHGGTLCVQAPATRTTVLNQGGDLPPAYNCTGEYWFHFSEAYLASRNVLAGETIYVQYSGRDPTFGPPFNHSLSAALQVTILP